MKKNWTLVEYKEGDEEHINPLLNEVYNINRDLSHWRWEFKECPDGSKIVLAIDGSRIIGHIASTHRKIKLGDAEDMASLEVEGITHPKYQRQGIFIALGKKILSDLKSEGVSVVYGFPNDNALPGHKKLHCIELLTMHVMIRPVNFKKISERMLSNRFFGFLLHLSGRLTFKLFYRPGRPHIKKEIKISTVSQFDSRFDDFWKMVKKDYKIILIRDSKYLNWRYTQCPDRHYRIYVAEENDKIIAWIVVRIFNKFDLINGAIVDILSKSNCDDIVCRMLLKIEEDLIKEEVDLIACSIPKWSEYTNIFRKSGFIICPKKLNPRKEPFIIYPLSKELDAELIKDPSNWFVTWGDTDVV